MDNAQGKKLDQLFRQRLEHLEQSPQPQAWERLSQRLESQKVPFWWLPAKYAAGFFAVVGLGILLYLTTVKEDLEQLTAENVEVSKDTENIPNQRVLPDETPSAKEILEQDSPASRQASPPKVKVPSAETTAGTPQEEAEVPTSKKEIPLLDIPKIDLLEIELPSLVAEELPIEDQVQEREVEYKVRIVSRGYAFSPDKGDIVDGIEQQVGKIGNFLTKVDQGFSDLQDAKNDFFALVVTKKEKQ